MDILAIMVFWGAFYSYVYPYDEYYEYSSDDELCD